MDENGQNIALKKPRRLKQLSRVKRVLNGRPQKYQEVYAEEAYKLCLLGMIDADLAKHFAVSEVTINNWKKQHENFGSQLRLGKQIADGNVAHALYQRATGSITAEESIIQGKEGYEIVRTMKQHPPDSNSIKFWLKNRQSANWTDSNVPVAEQQSVLGIHIHHEMKPEAENEG